MGGSTSDASADRMIVGTRVFDAPRELVFRMFTEAEHIAQWWGPRGFRVTTSSMDVRVGGLWQYVMHGPDGTDYPNWVRYTEVKRPERLAYEQGDTLGQPAWFSVIATFDAVGGDKTKVTMAMTFPTKEARDTVVRDYGAVEGMEQTLARLDETLAWQAEETFVVSREFDAPRELVFKAWTEPERLAQWWGPKGMTVTTKSIDVRPGGVFHYRMDVPSGGRMWGRFVYREIAPPHRLVFVNSFSDESAGLARAPFSNDFPLEMLSAVLLEAVGDKTRLTLRAAPLNATPAERRFFHEMHRSMQGGWGGTLDQLAAHLANAEARV